MKPKPATSTWLLAFDGSCCTCRGVSTVVADTCGDLLHTVPLDRPDIAQLRVRALGADAPHVPTLLAVDGEVETGAVRAYTGARLATRLVKVVGARRGARILRELGTATRPVDVDSLDQAPARGMSRKGFLQLATGATVAGGIVLFGKAPAAVATRRERDVMVWAAKNRSNLPTSYEEVAALPVDYRRAAYAQYGAGTRKELWLHQLDRFEKQMAPLDSAQTEALASTRALLRSSHFGASRLTESQQRRVTKVSDQMRAAFGDTHARRAIAELGPADEQQARGVTASGARPQGVWYCSCAQGSDWCAPGTCGYTPGCTVDSSGCGSLYSYECNGICH